MARLFVDISSHGLGHLAQTAPVLNRLAALRPDLLRSVDAIVTKPGYGTFAEAACNGTAVLYQRRDDGWPEQDCLIDWLQAHARCAEVTAGDLLAGNLGPALETCLHHAVPPAPTFDGADTAAHYLMDLLA